MWAHLLFVLEVQKVPKMLCSERSPRRVHPGKESTMSLCRPCQERLPSPDAHGVVGGGLGLFHLSRNCTVNVSGAVEADAAAHSSSATVHHIGPKKKRYLRESALKIC